MNVIPGGTFCFPASLLKRFGLRSKAFPFDWLFLSIDSLILILSDDFREFLDHDLCLSFCGINDHQEKTMHLRYDKLNPLRPTFAHKNILNQDVYSYYSRTICRFRNMLCHNIVNLFIFDENGESDHKFNDLVRASNTYSQNLSLKVVRYYYSQDTCSISLIEKQGVHERYNFHASRIVDGLNLEKEEDEVFLLEALGFLV